MCTNTIFTWDSIVRAGYRSGISPTGSSSLMTSFRRKAKVICISNAIRGRFLSVIFISSTIWSLIFSKILTSWETWEEIHLCPFWPFNVSMGRLFVGVVLTPFSRIYSYLTKSCPTQLCAEVPHFKLQTVFPTVLSCL